MLCWKTLDALSINIVMSFLPRENEIEKNSEITVALSGSGLILQNSENNIHPDIADDASSHVLPHFCRFPPS